LTAAPIKPEATAAAVTTTFDSAGLPTSSSDGTTYTHDAIGELTPMEDRVARLAAAGRTNREIAETLFLSVRTVEHHLSHVYVKRGVRSRTELALVLDEDSVPTQ
jgi:DNA-binding NarL/FixJ family response regulator